MKTKKSVSVIKFANKLISVKNFSIEYALFRMKFGVPEIDKTDSWQQYNMFMENNNVDVNDPEFNSFQKEYILKANLLISEMKKNVKEAIEKEKNSGKSNAEIVKYIDDELITISRINSYLK